MVFNWNSPANVVIARYKTPKPKLVVYAGRMIGQVVSILCGNISQAPLQR